MRKLRKKIKVRINFQAKSINSKPNYRPNKPKRMRKLIFLLKIGHQSMILWSRSINRKLNSLRNKRIILRADWMRRKNNIRN